MDDFDPMSVTWVLTEADLEHLIEAVATADVVVMDLETTGLNEWATTASTGGVAARVVLASFTLPQQDDTGEPTTWVLPLYHPESSWLGRWRRALRRVALAMRECALVNHNVKFDVKWVKAHTGVDLSHTVVWDTMVSSHLLDENSSTRLKVRAPATFGVPPWDDFDLTAPGAALRVPLIDLGLYAARDTYWTWRLYVAHTEAMHLAGDHAEPSTPDEVELARLGRLAVWCAMPTVATLSAVEIRGMVLDVEWVREHLADDQAKAMVLHDKLSSRYSRGGAYDLDPDDASFAPTSTWFGAWSRRAVAEGDLTIDELTPTGKPRWSKGVLVRQARAGSGVAAMLLDLRSHTKKAEFLTAWLSLVTPNGLIHTTYNVGRVVTGRLSSESPNMQQVTASLKPAFVPTPGYLFADFDYGQIELRVAAFISRCAPMIEAFVRGDDLHRLLAARITGKTPTDVSPEERQAGKSANFGLLYGMSAYGFRMYAETVYGVSFTVAEAVLVHRTFFDTWDGLTGWHARTAARAHATGQVTSPIGRVRRVPDIWDANERLVIFSERVAINSPVQGFASDLMQMAAASIEGTLPGVAGVADARIVGTVHDSILVEVPEHAWEPVVASCRERMLDVTSVLAKLDCALDVPLAVDVKVGTRWGLSDVARLS